MNKIIQKFRGQNSISGATKILIATLFLSNILGVLRDHFLAQKIPTTFLDTYYAAFRLPDLIFNVLILGAISAAFIPVFTCLISSRQKDRAFEVANKLFSVGILFIIASIVGLLIFMPWLVKWLVPEFDSEKQRLTLKLARLFLLSPLFFSVSYLFTGILNSFKHFVVTSLAPLIYNFSIIIATLLLADRVGVLAPALGVVLGACLHMLVQLPSVLKRGFRLRLLFDFHDSEVKKIIRLMIPRSVGLGATQVMLIVFTAVASGLGGGAVAIFNLADNIQTMPTVVFATSVASALFPYLSEAHSLKNRRQFSKLLENAILMIMYFLIPISLGMILLRAQIVRIILGSGHFGWEETRLAAAALGAFSLSLIFSGLTALLAKAFYAKANTKTPALIGVVSILVSITSGLFFVHFWGVVGLAAGVSLAAFFNATCLLVWLIKSGTEIDFVKLARNFGKILLASILMSILIQAAKYAYGNLVDLNTFLEVLGQIAVSAGAGLIAYLAFTQLFRVEKFQFRIWENILPNNNNENF